MFYVPSSLELSFYVDAKYVVNIALELLSLIVRSKRRNEPIAASDAWKHEALFASNGDLWHRFVSLVSVRANVTFTWAKAHTDRTWLRSGAITKNIVAGNAYADAFANQGAKKI